MPTTKSHDSVAITDCHRRALASTRRFIAAIGPDQWDLPTPCDAWTVRELVNHVIAGNWWAAELATGHSIDEVGARLDGDLTGADPLNAYDASAEAATAAFDSPGALDAACAVSYGPVPGSVYAGHRFIDVFIHGWDIAVATGQTATLDSDLVNACWHEVEPQLEQLQASTMFGTSQESSPDVHDVMGRLLDALGRSEVQTSTTHHSNEGVRVNTPIDMSTINNAQFEAFVGRFVEDLGAVLHASTVVLGDRLGLYAAMADGAPTTADELAMRAGIDARYALEWLNAQTAANYVEHDPETDRYRLPAEHAAVLIDGASPVYAPGAFLLAASVFKDEPAIAEAFRTGAGYGWHQHNQDLFVGTERFFRPGYAANLVDAWLPSLTGVTDKLERGCRVADVGCGLGSSTILMAQAFPNSSFVGSDYHAESIQLARHAADDAGVADRVDFEVASAAEFTGSDFDLVTFFDCLHDMGDPVGAATHVANALGDDGTWMIVEPMAGETVDDNRNPVGKIFYAASAMICTPASRSQDVGLALGAQAPEDRLADVVTSAGFNSFRRATETPFNRIYEARC